MKTLFFIPFLFILLSSCDKGIDDPAKRNENWCWHVSKTTGKGEWIELGGSSSLPDGWYTMFYSNGNIIEKGKTQDGSEIDTVSIFDLNGKISKYMYFLPDTTYEYYVNDGPYKAWDNKMELNEEGLVKDHRISQQIWHGPFEYFVKIVDIYLPIKDAFSVLSKKIAASINFASDQDLKNIQESDFREIDSLFNITEISCNISIEKMNAIESYNSMPRVKITALESMKMHAELLKCLSQSIAILKTGFNEDNLNKSQNILSDFVSKDVSESKFSKAMEEFQTKYVFDLGQIAYLTEKYPSAQFH